jgi:uncharacterized protein YpmB
MAPKKQTNEKPALRLPQQNHVTSALQSEKKDSAEDLKRMLVT